MSVKKLCAAALALLLLLAPAALAASISVVVNADARAYRLATGAAESAEVRKGTKLKLTDYAGSWGQVRYRGRTAYIPLKYLDLAKPAKAYLAMNAEVYAAPGSKSLGTAPKGATVYFRGVDGEYARVSNRDGSLVGYVAKGALTTSKASALLATASENNVEALLLTAQKQLGRPYALIANPPKSFNCAAFVEYCFNSVQPNTLKGTLGSQARDERYERVNDIDRLNRGDLVFFNIEDESLVGHVGIYVGSGYFIHASATEMKVTVSELSAGYYRDSFSWGLRVFGA